MCATNTKLAGTWHVGFLLPILLLLLSVPARLMTVLVASANRTLALTVTEAAATLGRWTERETTTAMTTLTLLKGAASQFLLLILMPVSVSAIPSVAVLTTVVRVRPLTTKPTTIVIVAVTRFPVLALAVVELVILMRIVRNIAGRRRLALEAQKLDDALFNGVKHDSEFRVIPVAILSRHSVFLHLLRTRVRSEFDSHRGTTSCVAATMLSPQRQRR